VTDSPNELPTIRTSLSGDEVIKRAETLSRRGKLAGFRRTEDSSLFKADAFGNPFDADLICHAEPAGDRTDLRFSTQLKRKMPAIAIVLLVVTVWPGVWLTDNMLSVYWGTYGKWTVQMPWLTYAWYLPLTVLPLPWMWKGLMKKTRAAIAEHAQEQIAKIAKALEA